MASLTSLDLTLSLKPNLLHEKMGDFLKHLSTIDNTVAKSSAIIDYIDRLTEELHEVETCQKETRKNLMILYDVTQALGLILRDMAQTELRAIPTNEGCSYLSQNQQVLSHPGKMRWSNDLKAKFEEAVRQLGGPEAATPLRIIERMQVEGLTSDHVQSYLQKYRRQYRRLSAGSSQVPEGFDFGAGASTSAPPNNHHALEDGWFRG